VRVSESEMRGIGAFTGRITKERSGIFTSPDPPVKPRDIGRGFPSADVSHYSLSLVEPSGHQLN